jgi:DNA-binding transcriptional ArsR family regulator
MYNPTASPIILPDLGGCLLQYSVNEATSLSSQCLPSFTQIEAFEQTLLEQRLLPAGALEAGQNVISVALPGNALTASLNLDIAPPVDDFTVEWQDQLEVSIIGLGDALYADGEVMSTTMLMENVGNERQSMRFTDTCRAELWIVNDQGDVVFDSRLLKTCNAVDLDYNLDPEEEAMFTLPDWTFTDLLGYQISSGDYTAVIEVPQFHLSSSNSISHERLTATDCAQPLSVDLLTSLSGLENGFDLSVTVVPQVSNVDLRWIGLCLVTVSIVNVDTSEEVLSRPSKCQNHDGRHLLLPYNTDDQLVLNVGEIYMVDYNNSALPNGTYHLIVTLEANPSTSVGFVLEWPIVDTVAPEPVEIITEPQPEEARLVSGTWSGLLTEGGTCWILDSPQEGQLLLSRAALGSWTPQQGWSGTYQAVSTAAAPQCANFQAPSLELTGVETETSPIVEQPADQQFDAPSQLAIDEQTTPIATTLVVVITTTSLLSLLVTVVLGNESFRIPSTAAGLWFLGMVGRTHETTDGRYQRGRLMGYLTANPGCHFRALMAALDMSNGQITHHLRILESEEAIWRRKDGRLVRYYPLTNTMNPGMSQEELPVPPLSPDPNSLQGKILTLLDADGPMGEFPTQAELAKRLEKSQQLVSHHLRTLQKFGLVEKRKMGIKNRYKLTREAIFLLETNDDFIRD